MTATNQSTIQTEPFQQRLEELHLLLEMTVCAIGADLFTGQQREAKAAALSRIADKI